MNGGAGKGDSQRPCNKDRYDAGYVRIFHPKCPKCGEPMIREFLHIWGKYICEGCGERAEKQ
jgi:formylmethanofuran dehydrogenase subunit E